MKTLKMGVILLALLLAAMVMVPMVNAAEATAQDALPMNPAIIDASKIQIPKLQIDDTQPNVIVNHQFEVNESTTVSPVTGQLQQSSDQTFTKIPVGAIIYHYQSGITRVFDKQGTQILSANDKESPLEFTPGGDEKPATFICSVSNGAFINYQGNITYVNDKSGKLILTIIDESLDHGSKSTQTSAGIMSAPEWRGWIEDAQSNVNQITQFDTYWNVPTKPPAMESGKAVFLFNGIQPPDDSLGILQPVLSFYPEHNGQNWYGEAWVYNKTGSDIIGLRLQVLPGDPLKGRILRTSDGSSWYVEFDNLRTGETSAVYSNLIPRTNNLMVTTALEATQHSYTAKDGIIRIAPPG